MLKKKTNQIKHPNNFPQQYFGSNLHAIKKHINFSCSSEAENKNIKATVSIK